ncbi:hypothetical protein RSAG8_05911, partial [Rhizoctonia solani AG-8 WAC10335]
MTWGYPFFLFFVAIPSHYQCHPALSLVPTFLCVCPPLGQSSSHGLGRPPGSSSLLQGRGIPQRYGPESRVTCGLAPHTYTSYYIALFSSRFATSERGQAKFKVYVCQIQAWRGGATPIALP